MEMLKSRKINMKLILTGRRKTIRQREGQKSKGIGENVNEKEERKERKNRKNCPKRKM